MSTHTPIPMTLKLAVVCVLTGLFALATSSALALDAHDYLPGVSAKINEGVPAEGPHGEAIASSGPLKLQPLSMTVDSGHLWAVEGANRIDEFDAATGGFLAQLATRPEEFLFSSGDGGTGGIAVGHLGGQSQIYVEDAPGGMPAVGVYDEAGTLVDSWTGAGTPAGSFSSQGIDVAVDNSSDPLDEHKGDVFVASSIEDEVTPGVVDIFHPEADGKEHYVGQITGPSSSELFGHVARVAIDNANGDVVVLIGTHGVETADILEPAGLGQYTLAHEILGTPKGPFHEAFNLAIDGSSDEIYVEDIYNEGGFGVVIDQFSATGAYLGRITGVDTPSEEIYDAYALAIDPESHNVFVGDSGAANEMDVFGPDVVFPDVTTAPPSNVAAASATLNGTVNPLNAGAARCRFEWGTSKALGKTLPCEPEGVTEGASSVAVHAALSGLQSDTTYYYRLQAANANGLNPGEPSQDQEFTTPGPGIREASVSDLAGSSVTFEASINPDKVPSSVYFQYGTDTAYGNDVPAPPGEAIGSGEADMDVTPHHVQGLQAGTTYHYRVVVVTEPEPGVTVAFNGPDQVFTTQGPAAAELPDGRQWELVSPPDKKGARIYPLQEEGLVQAADSGDAIAYLSNDAVENQPQGFSNEMQLFSSRGPTGWSTRSIDLPDSGATGASIGEGQEYRLFSADLSQAVVQPFGSFQPGLSSEATEATAMLRSLDPSCGSSCYRPLVTGKPGIANVPIGTVFGEEPEGECKSIFCGPTVSGATPDLSHIIVGSGALEGEWSDGKLTPIDVPPAGAMEASLRFVGSDDPRGTISKDGSRVILADVNGRLGLYLRDLKLEKTVQLNTAEPACLAAGRCASGGGEFQLASADGSKVFFINGESQLGEPHRLTKDAAVSGQALYECEMKETLGELRCELSDIANHANGVLGGSEDGSYLYFVANSVLAQGAALGECSEDFDQSAASASPPGSTCNLYVRHAGVTKLVAILSGEDERDWTDDRVRYTPVRVSPDGNWVEFMSMRSLTGYDNRDAISGKPDAEVYLYDAATGRLVCASCDPTGARPIGAEAAHIEAGLTGAPQAVWPAKEWVAAHEPSWVGFDIGSSVHQPDYLSDSGRLFFDSSDSLVPQDVNGAEDVYEYEPPGIGNCSSSSPSFSATSDGCVGLISGGTSPEASTFQDASEDGSDVFFLTYSKLQPQDYDTDIDMYDAHECTSAAPCFSTPAPQPPACTTADACRTAPTPQPTLFGAPSSATFSGAGNVKSSTGSVAGKPLTRAQKLAKALKACRKRPKRKRAVCQRRAHAQYGSKKKGNR